jgi:EpsI family protein
MQEAKILRIACLVVAVAALLANHAFGRLTIPQPRRLPVESFPRDVAEWSGGPDRQFDAMFRRYAPTAAAVDRIYTRPDGTGVNLVLVTATDNVGIHDPQVCFPLQGWQIDDVRTVSVSGDSASIMTATRGADSLRVLYWKTAPTARAENGLGRVLAYARASLAGVRGESLLVRLSTPNDARADAALMRFASDVQPALGPLKRLARTR